jgi:hypothetical protein
MTIEVKELVIRSMVTDESGSFNRQDREAMTLMLEQMKSQVLSECRELLLDMINEQERR